MCRPILYTCSTVRRPINNITPIGLHCIPVWARPIYCRGLSSKCPNFDGQFLLPFLRGCVHFFCDSVASLNVDHL